jgi:hypothetical protein
MKKIYVFIPLLALLAGLTLTGCSKESDDPTNQLTVGKSKVEIKNFALYLTGQNANGYSYYFELVSDGISFQKGGGFLGAGSYLEFSVISSEIDGIASGDYVYDEAGTYPALTYSLARHCLDWKEAGSNLYTNITSGTLSVTRDNSNYQISFSGVDADGKKVTAYYKGNSIFYDWRGTKGASFPAR